MNMKQSIDEVLIQMQEILNCVAKDLRKIERKNTSKNKTGVPEKERFQRPLTVSDK